MFLQYKYSIPLRLKVSFTEEAQQEISNIEHLQSKQDASDLLVSTWTAHKLEHCKKPRDIFERSDISLATIYKNTNNFRSESSNREKRPTFLDFPLFPAIFRWDNPSFLFI